MTDQQVHKPLKDGDIVILINRVDLFQDKDYPIRYDTHGSYYYGRGVLRHVVVATIGFANDWTAYEGWCRNDMPEASAIQAVARNGDKIFPDRAKSLAEDVDPRLLQMSFRI